MVLALFDTRGPGRESLLLVNSPDIQQQACIRSGFHQAESLLYLPVFLVVLERAVEITLVLEDNPDIRQQGCVGSCFRSVSAFRQLACLFIVVQGEVKLSLLKVKNAEILHGICITPGLPQTDSSRIACLSCGFESAVEFPPI